tara:strand:- start:28140 stop:28925 length:786 start_codon:yes stop_codon:yes gene_type:complete
MNSVMEFSPYLIEARRLAFLAGLEIMRFYSRERIAFKEKIDKSPITQADEAADQIIVSGLKSSFPNIDVVSEEDSDRHTAKSIDYNENIFWLVDPLDGTKEFIEKNGDFTVNIGLIKNNSPIAGVIYLPARGECYVGESNIGAASWPRNGKIEKIHARKFPKTGPTIAVSRSHLDANTKQWIKKYKNKNIVRAGSALKFTLLASGKADIYPRFSRTMEWDTAAGHAIVESSGGSVRQPNGHPLLYGKPSFINNDFIAFGIR